MNEIPNMNCKPDSEAKSQTEAVRSMAGSVLPSKTGYYWQKGKHDYWKIVQICTIHGRFLICTDISHCAFSGRNLDFWEACEPIGEWIEIIPPNEKQ